MEFNNFYNFGERDILYMKGKDAWSEKSQEDTAMRGDTGVTGLKM